MPKFGIAYRLPLAPWLTHQRELVEAVEIIADEFRDTNVRLLHELARSYVLTVRAKDLSIGTPGPLRQSVLHSVSSIFAEIRPYFVNVALGFSRSDEAELSIPIPVCPNKESLNVVIDHALELRDKWPASLLFENIPSDLRVKGSISEGEFIGRLCEVTGSGILLDVTSVLVNGKNHGFDPMAWIREIDAHRIVQLHVSGYTYRENRWHDAHEDNVQQEVWSLLRDVLDYTTPEIITLERYGNFSPTTEFENQVKELRSVACAGSPSS